MHKIAYAVLPLLALLRLVNPGPAGVALGVTFLVGSLMSNVSSLQLVMGFLVRATFLPGMETARAWLR